MTNSKLSGNWLQSPDAPRREVFATRHIEHQARQRTRFACAALCLALAMGVPAALAHDLGAPVNDADLHWGPAPAGFAKGAEVAVISGNPFAQGSYVLRLKMPAGYKIAAHNHPTTEYVTVISGTFHLGMGDKLDPAKSIALTAGGFAEAPPKMNHYAWAETATVVQVHGQGPFAITYVNPKDDPSM